MLTFHSEVAMSETLTPELTAEGGEDYKLAIEQMFAEMNKVNDKMERDQDEINRLNTETREILERLKAA